MLSLYSIFHLNLAFSSIEEESKIDVIHNCYWPLLETIKNHNLYSGIELTGYTLEQIQYLAPSWVNEFRRIIKSGLCELIGSGYCQIIGPLVPFEVNSWNQKIGLEIYQNLLDTTPQMALVNEMAYSSGILEVYKSSGYKAIVMEWNNPFRFHSEWGRDKKYRPQIITDHQGNQLDLIWADSIAFQQFQRYVYGDNSLKDFQDYIASHISDSDRFFPFYASDAEVFGFRPGRFFSETETSAYDQEWKRVASFADEVNSNNSFQFILPSKLLSIDKQGPPLQLESAEQPIPVKKQEKYNINRWALTGRADLQINTRCFRIFDAIRNSGNSEDWRQLCYFWSSDFRTHITKKRWKKYLKELHQYENHLKFPPRQFQSIPGTKLSLPYQGKDLSITEDNRFIFIMTQNHTLVLKKRKGLAINSFSSRHDQSWILGTIPHGYFDDISLGADFFSGHTLIEKPEFRKITDLGAVVPLIELIPNGVKLSCTINEENTTINKCISLDIDQLTIEKNLHFSERFFGIIYPFIFTLSPEIWDYNSLYYSTHNGNNSADTFSLGTRKMINHSTRVSTLVSSQYALGATCGIIKIGDKDRTVTFQHDPSQCALIPSLVFQTDADSRCYFRLQYSAQEQDETFKKSSEPFSIYTKISVKIFHVSSQA